MLHTHIIIYCWQYSGFTWSGFTHQGSSEVSTYAVGVFAAPAVRSPPPCQCRGPGRPGPPPAPGSAPRAEPGGLLRNFLHPQPLPSCGSHCCTFPGTDIEEKAVSNKYPGTVNQVSVLIFLLKINKLNMSGKIKNKNIDRLSSAEKWFNWCA